VHITQVLKKKCKLHGQQKRPKIVVIFIAMHADSKISIAEIRIYVHHTHINLGLVYWHFSQFFLAIIIFTELVFHSDHQSSLSVT